MKKKSTFLDQLPRPFIIFGMATTGLSIQKLLLKYGTPAEQILTLDDKKPTPFTKEQVLQNYSKGSLIVSPGISLEDLFIQKYLSLGGHLTSELEIAFSFLDSEKVIAITGSLGKSTTSALIQYGLKTKDFSAFLGGNFGTPLAEYVLKVFENPKAQAQFIILELSSYQLENFKNLKSDISVITYLSKNHLDRYPSVNDYYNTKLTLIHKTSGQTVCNQNGGDLFSYLASRPFPLITWTDRKNSLLQKYSLQNSNLIGAHNQDNLAMVCEVFRLLNVEDSCFTTLKNFSGLPHRLENLGEHNDILFINDSKATTIESVQEAIQNVSSAFPDRNIHVLLGGKDKKLPWENLSFLSSNTKLKFHFFGECRDLSRNKSGLAGTLSPTLGDCLNLLKSITAPSDVVLLSPGGTSLDEFQNFEERGDFFKNEILKYWSY